MATPKEDIENAVADIILADATFSSIAMLTIGFLYQVPLVYYPLCEVTINTELKVGERTGLIIRNYVGVIRFDVIVSDKPTTTANPRKVVIPSYTTVAGFVGGAVRLFNQQANRRLGDLTGTGPDWAVRDFQVQETIEYGIDQRSGREDSYENFGSVPFICETQEARS